MSDTELLKRIREVVDNKNTNVQKIMNDKSLQYEEAKKQIVRCEYLCMLEVESLLDGWID